MKHYEAVLSLFAWLIFSLLFILWHVRLEIVLNNTNRDIRSLRTQVDRLYNEIRRAEAAKEAVREHTVNTYLGGAGGEGRAVTATGRGVSAGSDIPGEVGTGDS